MNPVYLPALAALAGSMLGGLTSLASAWLTQHHQDRATRLSQDKVRRQKLYKQFIDEASKLYADALARDKAEISALVSVYALISRMRVVSSSAVVEKAEAVILMMPRGAEQSSVDPNAQLNDDDGPFGDSVSKSRRIRGIYASSGPFVNLGSARATSSASCTTPVH